MKINSLLKSTVLFVFLMSFNIINAQVPNQFKYQAVLRDSNGKVLINQQKAVKIEILKGSGTGKIVFTEIHNVVTSEQGVINLNIGSINSTIIDTINWLSDDYYIKVSLDNLVMGTSQILSVPYAIAAKTVSTFDYNDLTNKPNLSGTDLQSVYAISLPVATSVTERCSKAIEGKNYPTGWKLAAGTSNVDIDITHNLNRRVAYVSVWAIDGTREQQLFNTAAYNGIYTLDSNTLRIQSLATILKEIKIYIVFY